MDESLPEMNLCIQNAKLKGQEVATFAKLNHHAHLACKSWHLEVASKYATKMKGFVQDIMPILVGGPVQNMTIFQMAPIPVLSVLTCSTSSPHDILKISRKIVNHNPPVGWDPLGGTNMTIKFWVGLVFGFRWIFY
jgi:hypothetical protein